MLNKQPLVIAPSGEQASLAHLFSQAIDLSFQYLPLALHIAFSSTAVFLMICWATPQFDLSRQQTEILLLFYFVSAHAIFVSFLTAYLTLSRQGEPARGKRSLRFGARAAPCIALLMAPALILAHKVHYLTPVFWAGATFFAVPSHFVRFGWSGWLRLPGGFVVPAWRRAALLLPSLLFVSFLSLTLPGESWGLFDGGLFIIPMSLADIFWANYGCALFSSEFTGWPAAMRDGHP